MSEHRHAYVGHEPQQVGPLEKYRVPLGHSLRVVALELDELRGLDLKATDRASPHELRDVFRIPATRAPYWAGREAEDGVAVVAVPCPCGRDALSKRVDEHPTGKLARRLEDQDDELERQVREDVLELLERARGKVV